MPLKARICTAIALVLTASSATALAANSYVELLKERLPVRLAERNDPRVLDELELELLRCLVDAFVAANVPAHDLTKLDRAVAAGTAETDPLAVHYKQMASDPRAQALMAQEAERICPEVLQAYNSATQ